MALSRQPNEELKLPALASDAAGSLRSPAALLMVRQLNSGALDGCLRARCTHVTASRSAMLWATPLAFVVHNAEEAWTFPRYLPRVQALLPEPLRGAAISIVGIETTLIAVTVAFLALAAWATRHPQSGLATWAALLVPALGALNALTHIGTAVFVLHGYSPGVVTSVFLVAPSSALVLRRAWREHWLNAWSWLLLGLGTVLIHGPILIAVLLLLRAP